MTPLRQRMTDGMLQRGFSFRTQESYVDAIYGMAKHYRRDPAEYTAQEVEAYLLHMVKQRHLSYSPMNQAACAARFLVEKVLGHERELFRIPMAKVPAKQAELLAREEIARLFNACPHPVHRITAVRSDFCDAKKCSAPERRAHKICQIVSFFVSNRHHLLSLDSPLSPTLSMLLSCL